MYDSYRRFVQMYGDVVLGLKPVHKDEIDPFEVIIEEKKKEKGVHLDTDLDADDMKDLVGAIQDGDQGEDRTRLPRRPDEAALGRRRRGVRVMEQRPGHRLPEDVRHSRVVGNRGQRAVDGVRQHGRRFRNGRGVHARCGDRREHLLRRVPDERAGRGRGGRHPHAASDFASLREQNPQIYRQLDKIRKTLEKHYRDMMDVEFTIQQGKLYMLQCRVGKRTAFAAIKIAVDMVGERLITRQGSARSASSPIS